LATPTLCTHDGCHTTAIANIIEGGDQHQTVIQPRCAEHLGQLVPGLAMPPWEPPPLPIGPVVTIDTQTVDSNKIRELLALVIERETRQEQAVARGNELLTAPALGAYRQSRAAHPSNRLSHDIGIEL
jgi:hypothetical protein